MSELELGALITFVIGSVSLFYLTYVMWKENDHE